MWLWWILSCTLCTPPLYLLCRQDRFLWNVFAGIWFWANVPSPSPSLKAVVLLASDAGLGEESPHVSAGGAATILTQGLCVCVRTRVYVGNRMTHSSWNLFSLSESHHPQKSSPPFVLNWAYLWSKAEPLISLLHCGEVKWFFFVVDFSHNGLLRL